MIVNAYNPAQKSVNFKSMKFPSGVYSDYIVDLAKKYQNCGPEWKNHLRNKLTKETYKDAEGLYDVVTGLEDWGDAIGRTMMGISTCGFSEIVNGIVKLFNGTKDATCGRISRSINEVSEVMKDLKNGYTGTKV